MNMKQFRYVLILADKGSFSKAAEELNVSQPSLSQYIKRIEHDLGVILFDRTGGNVRLTDAGLVYIEAGRKILDTEKQMQKQFSDLTANQAGSIVVGIAPTRCQYLMPEIVKRFKKIYPGMHISIEERFIGNLVEDAEHGEFDLCVATLPVDENKFNYDLMMREEVVLAVPKSMDICQKLRRSAESIDQKQYPAIDIQTIAGSDYVFLSETQPTQIQLNNLYIKYNFSVKTAVECMSIETQYSMVKAGIGLALIPSSLSKYSPSANLEYFSLYQDLPYRDMAVIYRKGQYLSKALIALKEIMTSV